MSISLLPDRKEGDRLYRFLDCVCVCVCVCVYMKRKRERELEKDRDRRDREERERKRSIFTGHVSCRREREKRKLVCMLAVCLRF